MWPDEWKILVACILLNQTTRKQVDKILGTLFEKWPTPKDLMNAIELDVVEVIRPCGFSYRRARHLILMSEAYVSGKYKTVSDLPGIGEYGSSSHRIFCEGLVLDTVQDHALKDYIGWRRKQNGER